MSSSPDHRSWQPKCKHTKLLEHAVSTFALFPWKSKNQLTRLELQDAPTPSPVVVWHCSPSLYCICCQSVEKVPVYTDVLVPRTFSIGRPATRHISIRTNVCLQYINHHFQEPYKYVQEAAVAEDPCSQHLSSKYRKRGHRSQRDLHEESDHGLPDTRRPVRVPDVLTAKIPRTYLATSMYIWMVKGFGTHSILGYTCRGIPLLHHQLP